MIYFTTFLSQGQQKVGLILFRCWHWQDIDAVLDPVIGKVTVKRGRNILMIIGDNEVEYDSKFRMYLQTKLANPHYKPEIAAQTTLVNFCVTEKGLEDQLLALVVDHERPDLQEQAANLVSTSQQ